MKEKWIVEEEVMRWLMLSVAGIVLGGVLSLFSLSLLELNGVLGDDGVEVEERAIFSNIPVENEQKETEVVVMAVGDVMLGRSVNTRMLKYGDDNWPFEKVGQLLSGADVTLGNLENPLIENCPATDEGMIFCGRLESVKSLKQAGFEGMSLANNHSYNYGAGGVEETVRELSGLGIEAMGNGRVGEFEIKGVRIGVLAYDDVTKKLESSEVVEEIKRVRDEYDVLLVMIHWGVEYVDEPTGRQVDLGRRMIDAGVDVVLGSHPHWTQPVEEYKQGLIFYSLGNFVFDQMWSEATRRGEIAEIRLRLQDLKISDIEYEMTPVRIYDYGQPRLVVDKPVGK